MAHTLTQTRRAGVRFSFRSIAQVFAVAAQRRRLAELDDAMLRDLGLTRSDVGAELARPFWDVPHRG